MKDRTRIYFAHSMTDYGNPYEECSEMFIRFFLDGTGMDYDIFNPRFIETPPNDNEDFMTHMVRVFLPEVRKSDILIAIPEGTRFKNEKDVYTSGVVMEMDYAESIGIPTLKLPHIMREAGRDHLLSKMHIMMTYQEMNKYLYGIVPDKLQSWDSDISQL